MKKIPIEAHLKGKHAKERLQKALHHFTRKEVNMGVKDEKEHTPSPVVAGAIALTHLLKEPHYYEKMKAAHIESTNVFDFNFHDILETEEDDIPLGGPAPSISKEVRAVAGIADTKKFKPKKLTRTIDAHQRALDISKKRHKHLGPMPAGFDDILNEPPAGRPKGSTTGSGGSVNLGNISSVSVPEPPKGGRPRGDNPRLTKFTFGPGKHGGARIANNAGEPETPGLSVPKERVTPQDTLSSAPGGGKEISPFERKQRMHLLNNQLKAKWAQEKDGK